MPFHNRVALVSGAATGIGAACAERLAAEGAVVVIADLDEKGAERVAERITGAGGRALARWVDVTDDAAVERVVGEAAAIGDGLRIAVNCAGIRIVSISPGAVDTPMLASLPSALVEGFLATVPQQRMAQPSEIAALISFLASDEAAYVTGSDHIVDGGMMAR